MNYHVYNTWVSANDDQLHTRTITSTDSLIHAKRIADIHISSNHKLRGQILIVNGGNVLYYWKFDEYCMYKLDVIVIFSVLCTVCMVSGIYVAAGVLSK